MDPLLQVLSLEVDDPVADEYVPADARSYVFRAIRKGCPALHLLRLNNMAIPNQADFADCRFSQLRALSFARNFTSFSVIASVIAPLRALCLWDCAQLPQIQKLLPSIRLCSQLEALDASLVEWSAGLPTSLTSLKIDGTGGDEDDVNDAAKAASIAALQQLQQLQLLQIQECRWLKDLVQPLCTALDSLPALSALALPYNGLHIFSCPDGLAGRLTMLALGRNNLQELNLRGGVFQQLACLNVSNMWLGADGAWISPVNFVALASFSSLRVLNLSHTGERQPHTWRCMRRQVCFDMRTHMYARVYTACGISKCIGFGQPWRWLCMLAMQRIVEDMVGRQTRRCKRRAAICFHCCRPSLTAMRLLLGCLRLSSSLRSMWIGMIRHRRLQAARVAMWPAWRRWPL